MSSQRKKKQKLDKIIPSSFRDPSGFLFTRRGTLLRQVNKSYKENYEYLLNSRLYKTLTKRGLLISHKEMPASKNFSNDAYKTIKPEPVPFVSYPYEWCFSQLKDAALATLEIQRISLDHGMTLKDASAYNVQFKEGKPLLIDTLSFERYKPGKPWVAYKQFCQHFLAPLALANYNDIRLIQTMKIFLDGIPLDLTSSLLPKHTWLTPSLLTHIHLHAKSQQVFKNKSIKNQKSQVSKFSVLGLIDNLMVTISKLKLDFTKSEWSDYYKNIHYSTKAFKSKKEIVQKYILESNPQKSVLDLGANTGQFSRLVNNKNVLTISTDTDPFVVEKNYLEVKNRSEKNILPIVLDFANPSPGIGFENNEREAFLGRSKVDLVLALAVIHHLSITQNIPFTKIANLLNKTCMYLIIEFIPKNDPKVKKLLSNRQGVFINYDQKCFEQEFEKHFRVLKRDKINNSNRVLYLMKGKRKR